MRANRLFWALILAAGLACPFSISAQEITIKQGVVDTLKSTPRLEMMKYNREAVKYDLRKAEGGYYPKVNTRAAYGTDLHSDQVTRRENRDHTWHGRTEASLVVTQLLFDGNETKSQVKIDESRVESIDHRVFDNAESLALDAALAALEIYRQERLLGVAEDNVAAHEKILESLREMQEAGAGSIADVTQTRARLTRTQTTRITVKNDYLNAISDFERLSGYRPDKVLFPAVKPDMFLPPNVEELIKICIDNNPKLLAGSADIKAEMHRIELENSKFYPKVFFEAGALYEDGVEGDEDWSRNYSAMVRMNWNLYNGGSDDAAKSAALARKFQTEMERNELLRRITNEAKATWSDYEASLEEEKALEENVAFSRETKKLYYDQFSVGQRSLLDLLDAENEYFQSLGLYVTATVNRVANAYKLLALAGKFIEMLGIDPSIYKEPKVVVENK